MLVSVVIPCYRSAMTLPTVVNEIRDTFAIHPEYDYQIVLVNDGSPDGGETYRTIQLLCEQDKKIVGVDLSRNFGQACARMAALPYIKGDCAVYMDDDGQHPAEGIFTLVKEIENGYDVVYAQFRKKKHSLFKRITSNMNRRMLELLGVKPKGITTTAFFAWSRFSIDALKEYRSPTPSVGSYLSKVTSRFKMVDVEHRERIAGKSGYTLKKLIRLAINGFTNFTTVPLRISAFLGMAIAGIGFIAGLVIVVRKLIHPTIAMGYTSLMSIILLLGGLVLVSLGIIGEYIGRIYMILSDMPQYMVREVENAPTDELKETSEEVDENLIR